MSTAAAIARVTRAPGRLVFDPTESLSAGTFPFGGTEMGKANLCSLRALGESYLVEYESLGRPGDVLRGNQRFVFACFLRGWNDAVIQGLLQGSAGPLSQHGTFEAPPGRATGRSALARAVKLLYVPLDTLNVPALLIHRAVPNWAPGAELMFSRSAELGLPLSFECVRDSEGRILQVGRIQDLAT